jgi:hypothetical protein
MTEESSHTQRIGYAGGQFSNRGSTPGQPAGTDAASRELNRAAQVTYGA